MLGIQFIPDELSINVVQASKLLKTNMYTAISAAFLWPSHDDEVDWAPANQISHNSIQMYGGQKVSYIFREIGLQLIYSA